MLLECFNFWSQYLIFYVILEKTQQLVFAYLKSVFFNGLSILYVNKHVLWLMVRQFTPNTYYCSGCFYFISVETCSSKTRGQKGVLNTFCCHGWEMWHHFINGRRAGSERWGLGAPWLWEGRGNGNSQEWLSHGPSLRLLLSCRAQLGSRTLGQTQLLQGLELWENRWGLVPLQNVPNLCFLTLEKSFELLWCQCSDSRVGWFVFNLVLVDWGEPFKESNFCVSS